MTPARIVRSHRSDAAKAAISAFKAMNPATYEAFAIETEWLMTYLIENFDLSHYLHCIPDPSDESQYTTWRDGVLKDLVEEWKWSRGLMIRNRDSAQHLRFESYLHWYMEYERLDGRQLSGITPNGDLWQLFRILFLVDRGASVSQKRSENLFDDNETAERSAEVHDGGTVGIEEAVRQALRSRITQMSARPRSITDLLVEALSMPNRHNIVTEAILDNLLLRVREKHLRYRTIFADKSEPMLKQILHAGLNPRLHPMCEAGLFDLESSKSLGDDPSQLQESGVYLHILWVRKQTRRFWLYVGQAVSLKARIKDHSDNRYRSRHFSLHYHVWNSSEEMDSRFVTLYTMRGQTDTYAKLLLNLAEMWMACIFQTLSSPYLEAYLPEGFAIPWGGYHLNVALPLWQSSRDGIDEDHMSTDSPSSRQAFTAFLRSPDNSIREWAESWRDGFNQLRNSPDSRLRGYYNEHIYRSLKLASEELDIQKRANYQEFLKGRDVLVTLVPKASMTYKVFVRQFSFTINQDFGLHFQDGDKVFLRLHLADTEHPMVYTKRALRTDPARRLAVSLTGRDRIGPFDIWLLSHKGDTRVMKINHLIDVLEGYSLVESMAFGRRWFRLKTTGDRVKSRETIYT